MALFERLNSMKAQAQADSPYAGILRLTTIMALLLPIVAAASPMQQLNHRYATILERHIEVVTRSSITFHGVDYPALRQDADFPLLLQQLAQFPMAGLSSREQQLAFYINAYNILALNLIVSHEPVASIKDLGSWWRSVWQLPAGVVGGQRMSLDHIEHEILRPLGEPRIHMAIVCASLSCPDLSITPYNARQLYQQLDEQSRHFLANTSKGLALTTSAQGTRWKVSKIFDWFDNDFRPLGGVTQFILRYRAELNPPAAIEYFDYDWRLNSSH